MFSDLTTIATYIIINTFIWIFILFFLKKVIKNKKKWKKIRKSSKPFIIMNLMFWILTTIIYFLLLNISGSKLPKGDEIKNARESIDKINYTPRDNIKKINQDLIKQQERIIDEEVKQEQKQSEYEYEKFIKQSLKETGNE